MYKSYFRKWKYHVNPLPKYNDFIDYVDKKLLPLGFKKKKLVYHKMGNSRYMAIV